MAEAYKNEVGIYLTITWSIEDVMGSLPWLTEEEAEITLKAVARTHDCNYGINWGTFSDTATNLGFFKPEEESKPVAVSLADVKADCQHANDIEGYIYGIHCGASEGQVVDVVVVDVDWFDSVSEKLEVVADYASLLA